MLFLANTGHISGGWEGFRTFKVAKKEQESEIITSFYLVPDDGQPGQYISIKIKPEAQSFTEIRQYSLSDNPGKPYCHISTKCELGGLEFLMESYPRLHHPVEEGSAELFTPAGHFTLNADDKRPVVVLNDA